MKFKKFLSRINISTTLLLIIISAFILRTAWLHDNLFFGWEQGRDFLKLQEIINGDLTLLGPKTDIPGVFHGPLSYYIPLVPFVIFGGNPYWVLVSFVLINSVSIIFLYKAVENLFSKKVAILASIFYAVSYSAVIYSRWLSNPNLIPALAILYIYFLVKAKKYWKYLLGSAFCWGVMVHLLVVVPVSLIIPTIVYLRMEKIKVNLKRAAAVAGVTLAVLSSYFVFELKNGFLMTKSLIADQSGGKFWLSDVGFIDQFINEVIDGIIPLYPRFSFIVFMAVFIYVVYASRKTKNNLVILSFLFSVPILFFFISDAPLRHFFIATPIFLSIVLALVVNKLLQDKRIKIGYGLIAAVVLGNLTAILTRLPETRANFIHHAQRTYLADMKNLIDYVYQDADGKEFTYDYYSMPYWKEDAWIYLFQWYGKGKYGYAPQVDRTNVERSEIFYTLIEPNETAKIHQDNWYGEYKKGLELLDTYTSGKLKVEKRTEKEDAEEENM